MISRKERRQRQRGFATGRYESYPRCYGCGKVVSPDAYASHPLTDCAGDDGEDWGDTALVLCDRCAVRTEAIRNASEFRAFRDRKKISTRPH